MLRIDNEVSDQWGRMSAIRPVPAIDGLLAATALTTGIRMERRVAAKNRSFGLLQEALPDSSLAKALPEPDLKYRSSVRAVTSSAIGTWCYLSVRAGQTKGGGAGGIRTLDRALQPYNGLANRRLQPLGHSSIRADMPDACASRKRQIRRWWISEPFYDSWLLLHSRPGSQTRALN